MERLIEKTGSFGLFQKMLLLVIGPVAGLSGIVAFSSVFNNAMPKIFCKQKDTDLYSNGEFLSNVCEIMSNITLSKNLTELPYECHYDTEYYGITIVTEWNLICDKIYLASLTQTTYMLGSLSSIIVGYFSDKYGRKKICLIMASMLSLSLILCEVLQYDYFNLSVQSRYLVYLASQFIVGFSQYGLDISVFILFIELTSSAYGSFVSIFNLTIFAVGELVILAVSYYLRNWHFQNLFIASYTFIITIMIWLILPESPRFLISNRRYKEGARVLNRIGRFNGLITEANLINEQVIRNELKIGSENKLNSIMVNKRQENEATNTQKKKEEKSDSPILYYLTHPCKNLTNTFMLACVWLVASMCYYGMTFGITSISEDFNPYKMFLSCTVAEIIGMLWGFFGTQYSRRTLLIIYLLVAAIMSFLVAITPNNSGELNLYSIVIITSASFGKALVSCIFYLIYHYASKLYPTRVRNTLISFACCFGRLGAILAPQIVLLRVLVWSPLPYLIFGLNSLFALVCVFFLPCDKKISFDI